MTEPRTEHLTEMQIAGYLDRRLSAPDRDRVENHLAECADCRDQLSGAQQVLARARRPRRLVTTAGLLAAAAAVLVIVRVAIPTGDGEQPALRGDNSPAGISAYAPRGETRQHVVGFVWGATKDAASYRLSLSGTHGAQLWRYSGRDTTAVRPASVLLHPGTRYLW